MSEDSHSYQLSVRNFNGHDVSLLVREDGELWFVAKELCGVLGLSHKQAVSRLDDDEKGVRITDTPGGRQPVSIISEPGMYSLTLRSRKPEAKRFKRWVTHEVLPEIRRTGSYNAQPQPQPTPPLRGVLADTSDEWMRPSEIAIVIGVTTHRVGHAITAIGLKGERQRGIQGISRYQSSPREGFRYSPKGRRLIYAELERRGWLEPEVSPKTAVVRRPAPAPVPPAPAPPPSRPLDARERLAAFEGMIAAAKEAKVTKRCLAQLYTARARVAIGAPVSVPELEFDDDEEPHRAPALPRPKTTGPDPAEARAFIGLDARGMVVPRIPHGGEYAFVDEDDPDAVHIPGWGAYVPGWIDGQINPAWQRVMKARVVRPLH